MNTLWSNRCLACRGPLDGPLAVCRRCLGYLEPPDKACINCGLDLSSVNARGIHCGQCLSKPPPFPQLTACCQWNEVVQLLVHRLKYGGELVCARVFAEVFRRSMPPLEATSLPALVPMPLSRRRLYSRGFNQAEELVRHLAQCGLGRMLDVGARRRRHTPSQTNLERSERQANVKGCFAAPPRPKRRQPEIIIVDDLVTTTSSVTELSKTLIDAGYQIRAVWCLARVE